MTSVKNKTYLLVDDKDSNKWEYKKDTKKKIIEKLINR